MFSFVSGRSLIRDACTRKVQKHLHFRVRSRCLPNFCSGFPSSHGFRQALLVGAVVTLPVSSAVIFAKEPPLVSLSQIGEGAKDVITSAQSPYLRFDYISNLLSAVPLACCDSGFSVACYPSLQTVPRAIMKLPSVWPGLASTLSRCSGNRCVATLGAIDI